MEDFVTFEIAKKLKEKGFDEECYTFYVYDSKEFYREERIPCYNSFSDDYAAPTLQMAMKWLREKKKYHIEFVGNACGYLFIISDIPSEGGTDRYCSDYSGPNDGGTWDKYEDCAIASIEYVLDNLI